MMNIIRNHQINRKNQGQSIVEFALALPVVLLIVFGVIELGFLIFTYSSVNSASREAARYGIAIGDVAGGDQRFYDCSGIVEAGLKIGRFAGMTAGDIAIGYDHGPGTSTITGGCPTVASNQGADISFGDRIVITVNHQYQPLITYMGLNITPFVMTSTSARTIFKGAEIIPGGGDGGGGGGGGGGETCLNLTMYWTGNGSLPSASPTSSGTSCTAGQYVTGTEITLTAYPGAGAKVGSWTNATSINDTQATLTITADTSVTVNYIPEVANCNNVLTNLQHSGNGANPVVTNTSALCTGDEFAEGETVQLLAAPDPGWIVERWDGAAQDASNPLVATITMPAFSPFVNVAYKELQCYSLNTGTMSDPAWGGAPVPLTESPYCGTNQFQEGETVTLQAAPAPGYEVDSWNGATANPSNPNQATLVMPAYSPWVGVAYKVSNEFDAPSNLVVPNNFAAGDFKWNNGGGGNCTDVKFDFADSMPSAGNWPRLPDYYNVYVMIDNSGGTSTSVYQVTQTQWTNGATVGIGYDISFGVEAVFLNNPSAVSHYAEVTYRCLFQVLEYRGSLTRGGQ